MEQNPFQYCKKKCQFKDTNWKSRKDELLGMLALKDVTLTTAYSAKCSIK